MSTTRKPETVIRDARQYTEATYAAVDHYNSRDYDGAVVRLEEMARVNPNNIKVHEVLADAYLQSGRVDRAEREMATIRELASRLHPHLELGPQRSFEDLAREADARPELTARFRELLASESAEELARNTDVAAQLSVALMARGEHEKAERVLTRYTERLVALRQQEAVGE